MDTFRWTPIERKIPDWKEVAARLRGALAGYQLVAEQTPAAEAAARIGASLIRDRLLAVFDLGLVMDPSPQMWARAVLQAADADPYRDEVRDAIVSKDYKRLSELIQRPDALSQPPGFAAALGQRTVGVYSERPRTVLQAALRSRPGTLSLLMALGNSYPINQRGGG